MNFPSIIKTGLSILLLLCLLDMPYGYYQFTRFVALIGFAYICWQSIKNKRENEGFVYMTLSVLFQPFFKIAMGRTLWNIVDVVVAIGLILSLFMKPGANKPTTPET